MPESFKSGADLSAAKNLIVKFDSAGAVVKASAATDAIIGTIEDGGAASGDAVSVRKIGEMGSVVLGGTVDEGDALTSDANAKAVATTTVLESILGRAAEAGVATDVIRYVPMAPRY